MIRYDTLVLFFMTRHSSVILIGSDDKCVCVNLSMPLCPNVM